MKLSLDCDRNMRSHQLREIEIESIVGANFLAPESHNTQALVRSQGENGNRFDRMIVQSLFDLKTRFQLEIANNNRFLILPDGAYDGTLQRNLSGCLPLCRVASFQQMQS